MPVALTGFIGERTNRRVGLVTDDFRVYHRLAPFFEAHGVTLLGLRPGETVPPSIEALISGPADDPRRVALHDDDEATWIATMAVLDGRSAGRRAVIGVDPGDTFGLALLVDGWVYWWTEAYALSDVMARLVAWHRALSPGAWELRIGDGQRQLAFAVAKAARTAMPEAVVHIVPERGSTPLRPTTTSRHTDAAIAIALRET